MNYKTVIPTVEAIKHFMKVLTMKNIEVNFIAKITPPMGVVHLTHAPTLIAAASI